MTKSIQGQLLSRSMHLSNPLRSHLLPCDLKNKIKRQQTISSIGNQSTPLICVDFNET